MLTPIERQDIRNKKGETKIHYRCLCDCGKETIVSKSSLIHGKTVSCGCKKLNDLTGQRFGMLVAIEKFKDYNPGGSVIFKYRCICDCGNETIVSHSNLMYGNTISCGCSRGEHISERLKKSNKYDLSGTYGIGYTSNVSAQGISEFWFDLSDYDLIKDYCWHFTNEGYVTAKKGRSGKHISMHRLFFPDAERVDHIKHRLWDNRRSQLRPVTHRQNMMNRLLPSNNTSGYIGICWKKECKKWDARITVNGKRKHLGYYEKLEDAISARKEAEKKYFGEYSYDYSMSM